MVYRNECCLWRLILASMYSTNDECRRRCMQLRVQSCVNASRFLALRLAFPFDRKTTDSTERTSQSSRTTVRTSTILARRSGKKNLHRLSCN